MPPSVADQVRRIQYGGETKLNQLRRLIRKLFDRHALNRALFYGEDGGLKPEAVEWLADLGRRNFLFASTFHVDSHESAHRQGRRDAAMEIFNSLQFDSAKLEQLTAQAKEIEHGGR